MNSHPSFPVSIAYIPWRPSHPLPLRQGWQIFGLWGRCSHIHVHLWWLHSRSPTWQGLQWSGVGGGLVYHLFRVPWSWVDGVCFFCLGFDVDVDVSKLGLTVFWWIEGHRLPYNFWMSEMLGELLPAVKLVVQVGWGRASWWESRSCQQVVDQEAPEFAGWRGGKEGNLGSHLGQQRRSQG